MKRLVTVSVGKADAIVVDGTGKRRPFEFDAFDEIVDGVSTLLEFKDENGDPAPLVINGEKLFDLDNKIDVHNLDLIQRFYKQHGLRFGEEVTIFDPEAEIMKQVQIQNLSFEIEAFIRKHQNDKPLLNKIYRRLKGPSSGITDIVVFNTLINLAKDSPDVYQSGSGFIYESSDFQALALIDICLEKGFMRKDPDGTIRDNNGTIIAIDAEKAAFFLQSRQDEMEAYSRLAYGTGITAPLPYVPKVETAPNIKLKDEDNLDAPVVTHVEISSVTNEVIEAFWPKFLEEGFLIRTGAGVATRYSLSDLPGHEFKKKLDVVDYFQTNPNVFFDIKHRIDGE